MAFSGNIFSFDKIIGTLIFIIVIVIGIFLYYNLNNKNINKEKNNKILIIIDSSKTMEKYSQKIIKEINTIKNSPLNIFAQYYILTVSRQNLTENWTKEINVEKISINFFGPSQITSTLKLDSFDKYKEANKIIIITSKYNNNNQLTMNKDLENKIKSIKNTSIITIED